MLYKIVCCLFLVTIMSNCNLFEEREWDNPYDEEREDETPPEEVTGLIYESGDCKITLSWKNPDDLDFSSIEIWYGINNTDTQFAGTVDNVNTSIDNLINNTEYTFNIITVDSLDNKSEGSTFKVSTMDTLAPSEIANLDIISGDKSITLSWTNPTNSDFKNVEIFYGIGNAETKYAGVIDSNGTILSNLLNNSSYTIKIITVDNAGNKSVGTEFVVPTMDTLSAGEIRNILATSGDGQITLKWDDPIDEDFDYVKIFYGIGNFNLQFLGEIKSFGTILTDLTNNNEYSIKILTVDDNNNESIGTTLTVSTLDTIPPDEVNNLSVISGDKQILLNWDNITDSDFDHLEIWYGIDNTDTRYTGVINSQDVTVSGLLNNTEYSFKVITVDGTGNKSTGETITTSTLDTYNNEFEINIITPWDETITYNHSDNVVFSQNETFTVIISETYESYSWELYGLDLSNETNNSITIDCSLLEPGVHRLTSITEKDDDLFSNSIQFIIQN